MKNIAFIIVFIFILLNICLADEFVIPFSCWPKEIQVEFSKYNKKLDLTANERTKDSWGYILSKGSSYVIYTYQPATKEDFIIIRNVVFEIDKKMNVLKEQ